MPPVSPSSAGDQDVPACLEVLGLRPPLTLEDVKQAYLAKAVSAHPDRGGSAEQFVLLQRAFEEANDYVKFKASKLEWLASKIEAYAQQQEVATETIERGGEIEQALARERQQVVQADIDAEISRAAESMGFKRPDGKADPDAWLKHVTGAEKVAANALSRSSWSTGTPPTSFLSATLGQTTSSR